MTSSRTANGLHFDDLGFLVGQRRLEKATLSINADTQEIIRILNGMMAARAKRPPDNELRGIRLAVAQAGLRTTKDVLSGFNASAGMGNEVMDALHVLRAIGQHRTTLDTAIQDVQAAGSNNQRTGPNNRPTTDTGADAATSASRAATAPASTPSANNRPLPATDAPQGDTDAMGAPSTRRPPRTRNSDAPTANATPDAPSSTGGQRGSPSGSGSRNRDSQGRFTSDGSWFDKLKAAVFGGVKTGMADTQGVDPTVDAINELGRLMSPIKRIFGAVLKPVRKAGKWALNKLKRNEPIPAQQDRHNRRVEKWLKQIAESRAGQAVGNLFGGLTSLLTTAISAALGLGSAFVLGTWLGNKIYDFVEPVLSQAIDAIAAMPDMIAKGWASLIDTVSHAIEAGINAAKSGYDNTVAVASSGMEWVANKYQGLVNGASNMMTAADNYLNGTPSSDSPTAISKIQEVGKGYNQTQLADGSIVRRTGARNWRNNNAGNIEYGEFAKKHGAIGSDGRFAIFPTYEAGRAAKADLLFKGKNYKDKDLMGAINRYAPPKENNTASYQRAVLAAVGVNKRMADYTPEEQNRIMDAMQKVEGFKVGKTQVLKAGDKPTNAPPPLLKRLDATVAPMAKVAPAVPVPAKVAPAASLPAKVAPAASLPKSPVLAPLPSIPQTKQQLSGKNAKQAPVNTANDNIPQNVGDRGLAHAVTGGLGGRDWPA